jgi:hypothetical protein
VSNLGHFVGQWLIDENGGLETAEGRARCVFAQIRLWQQDGELPWEIFSFGELHDHFDVNVGWPDVIDNLPEPEWRALTDRVTELLEQGRDWIEGDGK